MAVPARHRTSAEIDSELGRPAGWLERQCGVRARFVCETEGQEELSLSAAEQALADAGMRAQDVDLVMFTGAVGLQPIPATAPRLAGLLGLVDAGIAAFDVNATCLGFLAGFDIAVSHLQAGRYHTALIIASDISSRALPWHSEPQIAGLFGDGAAACIVSTRTDTGLPFDLRSARFESYPEGYDYCALPAGGTRIDYHADPAAFAAGAYFEMNGRELYRLTATHFPAFVDTLLDRAGWSHDDVDLVVPHQANLKALEHLERRCGFDRDRVISIMAEYGNQVSASLPTALHLARSEGRIEKGQKLLMLGTSAGISFGGLALQL